MVKKKNKRKVLIGILILVLTITSLTIAYNLSDGFGFRTLDVSSDGSTLKYAIPHMASYRCEPVEDKYGIAISIPENGGLISKETVGFHTNGISNIKLSFTNSYWSTDWVTRAGYAVCDANGFNCGEWNYITDWVGGTSNLPLNSIDFETESLKLIYQRIPWYGFGGYQNAEGLKVSFDGKAFGLRLYSTTRDPAGAKICTTSCNLNCPNIGYREKLLLTNKNTLGFYETAPYLEYWETFGYDLNAQGGATIYNPAKNEFCFAGTIYNGAELKMDNGVTYLYPDTNTRQYKLCCPGAVISSTYSDQICQDDYTWKVIKDTDKLTCFSDFNCPGQGGATCQNKILAGYHCQNKDNNNVGVCVKELGIPVECCVNGDCARDQVCDISDHTCKGGTILPVCGDGNLDAGEQCDDGNTISGDGCTSTCETEVEYCLTHPEDPICTGNTCSDCDAFAMNKIFGETGIWKSKSCEPKSLQNNTLCFTSFIKLALIPLVLIFASLFGFGLFDDLLKKSVKEEKTRKILAFFLSLIVAGILSWLVYILFWVGVIAFIIFLIIKFAIGYVKPV